MKKLFFVFLFVLLGIFFVGCTPKEEVPTPRSIEVVSTQTSFDQTFELSDLSVRVHMSDGTFYDVPLAESMLSSSDLLLLNQTGTHNILVTYLSYQAPFEITITAVDGADGREVELQATTEYIQWRYVGDTTWKNLIALSLLKGAVGEQGQDGTPGTNGKEVEFNVSATHIQWRYVGDVAWTNLIALSSLKGLDGTAGVDGKEVEFGVSATHIQWRYVGGTTWFNLVALDTLKGANGQAGAPGSDGKQIEFSVSTTHIVWRYVGDTAWNNLLALSAIKGADGEASTISINEDGYWVINGVVTTYKASGTGSYTPPMLTVTFDLQGGSMPSDIPTVVNNIPKGDAISLPIPLKEGYVFKGWFSGFGVNDGQFLSFMPVAKSMTLYAKWEIDTTPLEQFFDTLKGPNYTFITTQESVVNAGPHQEQRIETNITKHDIRDGKTYIYEKKMVDQTLPIPYEETREAYRLYERIQGNPKAYHYVQDLSNPNDGFGININPGTLPWVLYIDSAEYHPDFSVDFFDLTKFTKRPGKNIYDYTDVEGFMREVDMDLPTNADVEVLLYIDLDLQKFFMIVEMSAVMNGMNVTATMTNTASFTNIGTTEVTFPIALIKQNLLSMVDEAKENRQELNYATTEAIANYYAQVEAIKIEIMNLDDSNLDGLVYYYNNFRLMIWNIYIPFEDIEYQKFVAKNTINTTYNNYVKDATQDSIAAMENIKNQAFTQIDASDDENEIDTIVNNCLTALLNAYVFDSEKNAFERQQEEHLGSLLVIYNSLLNATDELDEKEALEDLYNLHRLALEEATTLEELDEAFQDVINDFYNFEITLNARGLFDLKLNLTHFAANSISYLLEHMNDDIFNYYHEVLNSIWEATTIKQLFDIFLAYEQELDDLELAVNQATVLAYLAKQMEAYLLAVDLNDKDQLQEAYDEIIGLIQEEDDLDKMWEMVSVFIGDIETDYSFDELLLYKTFNIAGLEFEFNMFKSHATEESITNMAAALLTHKQNILNAENPHEVDEAYNAGFNALNANFVPKQYVPPIYLIKIEAISSWLGAILQNEDYADLLEKLAENELAYLARIDNLEEGMAVYDNWLEFIQSIPFEYNQEQVDFVKDMIIEYLEDMIADFVSKGIVITEQDLALVETAKTAALAANDFFDFADYIVEGFVVLLKYIQ